MPHGDRSPGGEASAWAKSTSEGSGISSRAAAHQEAQSWQPLKIRCGERPGWMAQVMALLSLPRLTGADAWIRLPSPSEACLSAPGQSVPRPQPPGWRGHGGRLLSSARPGGPHS